jgi:plasmid stability protein
MGDLLIRNVPDEVLTALSKLAAAQDKDRQTWVREKLIEMASQPVVRERYVLKAYGENGGYAQIRRADSIGGGAQNLSDEQMAAYRKARDFVQNNKPGDREEAIKILKTVFETVFETLM